MADDTERFIQLQADKQFVYKIDGEHKEFEEGEKFSAQHKLAITLINDIGTVSKTGKTQTVEQPENRIITEKPEFDKEYDYAELQKKAKNNDIKANQSKEELKQQLGEKDLL